ncbi:MAG: T9SS type A sorting domain-containing protein [Bacteroidia bacterium]|nr:T9SS type A sorting domain-containing protein [Bacteroidia bacterium]
MMRKISILTILSILVSFQFLAAQNCGVFYDGFESGSYSPTWVPGAGAFTYSVTTNNPAAGTYAFQIDNGFSNHWQGITASFTPSQPTYISVMAKSGSVSLADTYFCVGDVNYSSNIGVAMFYFRADGYIAFLTPGTYFTYPYNANQWYHIEFKNINWTTKTYEIWVDGVLGASNYSFYSTSSTNVSRIHCYNFHANSTSWFDDVIIGNLPLQANLAVSDVTCNGTSDGSVAAAPSGGTPGYSYLWSTGATVSSISGLPGGTYSVAITDTNGCTTTDSTIVYEPTAITTSAGGMDPTCNNSADGSAWVMASGGSGSLTYLWSNSDTTDSISGLGGGTYQVVVTDTSGCSASDSAMLTAPAALDAGFSVTNVTCNGSEDGMASTSVTGGTPGYTYVWSTGDTTASISGLTPGTYSVTITDQNGCMTADSGSISQPAAIISSGAVTDETNGAANGAIDLTASGGTAPLTFSWSNFATTEDISGLTAGTYTVTITDAMGCVHMDTFQVTNLVGLGADLSAVLNVFPNPSKGIFNLEFTGNADESLQILVFDPLGRQVRSAQNWEPRVQPKVQINLEAEALGWYILVLKSDQGQAVYRLNRD